MWSKGGSPAKGSAAATTMTTQQQQRDAEQTARNELFAGAPEEINIDTTQIPLEHQTVDQLVGTAVRTHKDTTVIAQRALRVVQESKQIQVDTMKKLEEQNETMRDIDERMNDMNEELTYAEKLLSYMRRCCCLWICDTCTGADPEERRKRDWQRRVDKGETRIESAAGWNGGVLNGIGGLGRKGGAAAGGANGGEGYVPRKGDPDIRLPEEHRGTEMRLHEETRKQNDMIDQIHAGLDQLLEGAKVMNDELATQNRELDVLDSKATATRDRLNDVNKNSQLRNFARGKPKARQEDTSPLPTQTDAALAAAKRLAGF